MAVVINTVDTNYFTLNGTRYAKIYQPLKGVISTEVGLYNAFDTCLQLLASTPYTEYTVDGVSVWADEDALMIALLPVVYKHVTAGGSIGSLDWGNITGTLSAQVDLQAELDNKSDVGHTHTFASLDSKPTTIAGFGITDAYTESEVDTLLSGKSDNGHTHTISEITDFYNLYTANGALTGARTVDLNGNELIFDNAGTSIYFNNGRIGAGDINPWWSGSQITNDPAYDIHTGGLATYGVALKQDGDTQADGNAPVVIFSTLVSGGASDGYTTNIKNFKDDVQVISISGVGNADFTDPNREVETTFGLRNDYTGGQFGVFDTFNNDYPNGTAPEVRQAQGWVAIHGGGATAKEIGLWRYDTTTYTPIFEVSPTNVFNFGSGVSVQVDGTDYFTPLDYIFSVGTFTEDDFTDNGDGTIDVPAHTVHIKATDTDTADTELHTAPAVTSLSLTDNAINYIYVEWNSGTPQIVATTVERTNYHQNVFLGTVLREGTTLHIDETGRFLISRFGAHALRRWEDTQKFARVSGGAISEQGTRNFAITTSKFWRKLHDFTLSAVDTSASDTFSYWYKDGVGGWTEVTGQTQIDNTQYDDGSGTLATLTNNRYGVHFVYRETEGHLMVVYGTLNTNQLSDAQDAEPPTDLPPSVEFHGILFGKIIIEKNSATFEEIQTAFTPTFQALGSTGGGTFSGTVASGQVAYGTALDTLGGDADFTFTPASNRLNIGSNYIQAAYPQMRLQTTGGTPYSDFGTGTGYTVFNAVDHVTNIFQFRNNASARWTLDLSGNVSQVGSLTVEGNILQVDGVSPRLYLNETGGANGIWTLVADGGNLDVRNETTADTILRFKDASVESYENFLIFGGTDVADTVIRDVAWYNTTNTDSDKRAGILRVRTDDGATGTRGGYFQFACRRPDTALSFDFPVEIRHDNMLLDRANLVFQSTSNIGILQDVDSQRVLIGGGSAWSGSNGAYIEVQGVDYGGVGTGGDINFQMPASGSATFSQNVWINTGKRLTVTSNTDGNTMLRFNTDRPWAFRQRGTGASTSLQLYAESTGKRFEIGGTVLAAPFYVEADTGDTSITGTLDVGGLITANGGLTTGTNDNITIGGGGKIINNSTDTKDKIRVWTSDLYTIGMKNSITLGGLSSYAMTFQMNDNNTRGFWWGHDQHALSGGAMALTVDGFLTLANHMRVGYGESDTTDPASSGYTIQANGTMQATNFILSSDARFKENIVDYEVKPINVRWREFDWKEEKGGQHQLGAVAQELEEEHPEFVITDGNGDKSIKYTELLIAKNAELEAKVARLEYIVEQLLKDLD